MTERDWCLFLKTLRQQFLVPAEQIDNVKKVRYQLHQFLNREEFPPQASHNEENHQITLAWNIKNFYIEVDISVDGSVYWFCMDETNDSYTGADGSLNKEFPSQTMKQFLSGVKKETT